MIMLRPNGLLRAPLIRPKMRRSEKSTLETGEAAPLDAPLPPEWTAIEFARRSEAQPSGVRSRPAPPARGPDESIHEAIEGPIDRLGPAWWDALGSALGGRLDGPEPLTELWWFDHALTGPLGFAVLRALLEALDRRPGGLSPGTVLDLLAPPLGPHVGESPRRFHHRFETERERNDLAAELCAPRGSARFKVETAAVSMLRLRWPDENFEVVLDDGLGFFELAKSPSFPFGSAADVQLRALAGTSLDLRVRPSVAFVRRG